jgi:hypothetical protein
MDRNPRPRARDSGADPAQPSGSPEVGISGPPIPMATDLAPTWRIPSFAARWRAPASQLYESLILGRVLRSSSWSVSLPRAAQARKEYSTLGAHEARYTAVGPPAMRSTEAGP